jgi:hypothetical protein
MSNFSTVIDAALEQVQVIYKRAASYDKATTKRGTSESNRAAARNLAQEARLEAKALQRAITALIEERNAPQTENFTVGWREHDEMGERGSEIILQEGGPVLTMREKGMSGEQGTFYKVYNPATDKDEQVFVPNTHSPDYAEVIR